MNVDQAMGAYEHAMDIVRGCRTHEELDEESDIETANENCPDDFSNEQKDLAQQIILHNYLKSIGRA